MTRRTAIFRWKICCYDERETNIDDCKDKPKSWVSQWNEDETFEDQFWFVQSLTRWRDKIEDGLRELILEEGESDCQDIKEYHHLCDYILKIIDVTEEEGEEEVPTPKKIPPRDIKEKRKRLEKAIRQKRAELEKLETELDALQEEYEFEE